MYTWNIRNQLVPVSCNGRGDIEGEIETKRTSTSGRDTEKNKELDALGVRYGGGTEWESDTRLQPSNKNSAEQYMTAIIGTYGLDSHFPAVSLCLGIPNLQGSLFSTVHVVVPPALAPVTHTSAPFSSAPLILFRSVDVHQTGHPSHRTHLPVAVHDHC